MRAASRSDEFRMVQRESMQVAAELRKALGSVCQSEASSPVQGGLHRSPSPLGGTFVPRRVGLVLYVMGADTVSDRRNSRLP
jgi:hypothetical protein